MDNKERAGFLAIGDRSMMRFNEIIPKYTGNLPGLYYHAIQYAECMDQRSLEICLETMCSTQMGLLAFIQLCGGDLDNHYRELYEADRIKLRDCIFMLYRKLNQKGENHV